MKARSLLFALAVIAASGVCVRLGVWQLQRRAEKQVLHAAQQAALAAPPMPMRDSLLATPPVGVRVLASGRWDGSAHVLLSGRTHLGAAGVICVTPLVLANGERILVERGWLEAADSRTAAPPREDTARIEVMGVVQPYGQPATAIPWARLSADSTGSALWSARALVADQAREALGSPLAGWVLRVLPTPEDASYNRDRPMPEPYVIEDESMHLSYAIQWFAFAAIVLLGSLALARRRR